MANKAKFTVIIPAYNEAENIEQTLESLRNQVDDQGKLLDRDLYQVVLVDNNSTDNTLELVKKFSLTHGVPNVHIVKEQKQGITPARIRGYNFVLDNQDITTPYLASGDSDIWFHPKWVYAMLETFKKHKPDVISNAGCFADRFWEVAPNLADRYLEEIGTIFFNPDSVRRLAQKGATYNFTEQLFLDFGRQVTDGCFAISREAYQKYGGYTLEYWDNEEQQPVHGEGWRLCFRVERNGGVVSYSNEAPYSSNPRRILEEPEKFLGAVSYDKDMKNWRNVPGDAGERLNQYAKLVDLEPIKRYIVDYYILLRCIVKPDLVLKNEHYFEGIKNELFESINKWWDGREEFHSRDLFTLSHQLGDKYGGAIIDSLPGHVVKP